MTILQAPPTSAPVTRRTAALLRDATEARAVVQLPQPGERGHLRHALVTAIRTRNYSRRTAQAYWHWTAAFVRWSGRHSARIGAASQPARGAMPTRMPTVAV